MNRAERLDGALESVFAQSYETIEAVIVDGGSTDRTPDVASKYRERYPDQVTYIRNEEPQGLPAARNRGFEETDADLIAFLDDDDRWDPTKIEKQVRRFEQGIGLCYTGLVSKTPEGSHVHTKKPSLEGNIYENLLVRNNIGTPTTVVVTSEAFESIGRFDESLHYQEDWDLYIRIAREWEVACVSDPLVMRLYHEKGMSRDVEQQKKYRERILQKYSDELQNRGLESEAWAAHHRDAGIVYCLNGEVKSGRMELREALRKQRDIYTAAIYLFTLLGEGGFEAVIKLKRKMNQKFDSSAHL